MDSWDIDIDSLLTLVLPKNTVIIYASALNNPLPFQNSCF